MTDHEPTDPTPLAIAFFDVEGYTEYTAKHGDDAGLALAQSLLEIAEQLVGGARGTVVKRLGDGLLACFPSARDAVRCALGVQRALGARAELSDDANPVAAAKVAIHWGQALRRDGDLYGNDVNVTARLVEQARGGQVLITDAVAEQLDLDADGLEVKRVGRLSGKGLKVRPQVLRVRQRHADIPQPIALGGDAVLATFLFDAPGDDMDAWLAGIRAAEAALNGVGARVIYAGVSLDEDDPDMCALIAFPSYEAFETFAEDPDFERLRELARGVVDERVLAAYHPMPDFGTLFLGGA